MDPWISWNIGTSSSTSSTTDGTNAGPWYSWNTNYLNNAPINAGWCEPQRAAPRAAETEIQREARRASEREAREIRERAYQARKAARTAAEERAEALLHSILSAEQVHMLTKEGRFLVECNSGRVYEIKRGFQHNVYLLDSKGERVQELCGHTRPGVPIADHMVAQYLYLLQHEDKFRKVSNIWDLKGHRVIGSRSGEAAPVDDRLQRVLRAVA